MSKVVVVRDFPEGLTLDRILQIERDAAECSHLYGVERTESFLSADNKRLTCIYNAPDAEAVRKANDQAQIPYTAIFAATLEPSG
jgi:hypothetical protein